MTVSETAKSIRLNIFGKS